MFGRAWKALSSGNNCWSPVCAIIVAASSSHMQLLSRRTDVGPFVTRSVDSTGFCEVENSQAWRVDLV